MLGFVAALFMELYTGKPVLQQALEEPRTVLVVFTLVLVASLYPLTQNVTPDTEAHGPFQADAEMWGGRAACASCVVCWFIAHHSFPLITHDSWMLNVVG